MRWTEQQLHDWQGAQSRLAQQVGPGPIASPAPSQTAKRPKYGNRKVTDAEGNEHASTKQFRRWQVLELRQRAGEIRSLRREVPYALVVNGVLICRYIADHVYEEGAATIVEDVKSEATRGIQLYRVKKLLMKACHNIDIREV